MLQLFCYSIAVQAALLAARVSASSETVTGPVEFVWPEQRAWYAAWQTNSPCGTNDGTVGNRTIFPLGASSPPCSPCVKLILCTRLWQSLRRGSGRYLEPHDPHCLY